MGAVDQLPDLSSCDDIDNVFQFLGTLLPLVSTCVLLPLSTGWLGWHIRAPPPPGQSLYERVLEAMVHAIEQAWLSTSAFFFGAALLALNQAILSRSERSDNSRFASLCALLALGAPAAHTVLHSWGPSRCVPITTMVTAAAWFSSAAAVWHWSATGPETYVRIAVAVFLVLGGMCLATLSLIVAAALCLPGKQVSCSLDAAGRQGTVYEAGSGDKTSGERGDETITATGTPAASLAGAEALAAIRDELRAEMEAEMGRLRAELKAQLEGKKKVLGGVETLYSL